MILQRRGNNGGIWKQDILEELNRQIERRDKEIGTEGRKREENRKKWRKQERGINRHPRNIYKKNQK